MNSNYTCAQRFYLFNLLYTRGYIVHCITKSDLQFVSIGKKDESATAPEVRASASPYIKVKIEYTMRTYPAVTFSFAEAHDSSVPRAKNNSFSSPASAHQKRKIISSLVWAESEKKKRFATGKNPRSFNYAARKSIWRFDARRRCALFSPIVREKKRRRARGRTVFAD